MKFVYTVWFQDPRLPPGDQDREWPACFVVDGSSAASALAWGDRLAARHARSSGEQQLKSAVEALDTSDLPGVNALPIIMEGESPPDEVIGW